MITPRIHALAFDYRPFIDPVDVWIPWIHDAWVFLLIPLAFGISVVYRAIRVEDMRDFWPSVLKMTAQVVLGIIALALAGYIFVLVLLPLLMPMPG
ncbi:MAG: hypothetical protein EA378_06815 [Phycisphaerales bacterium]|nr:MAG: hypothetical protein EA378_06815 [Phycisphaerales bacterium]